MHVPLFAASFLHSFINIYAGEYPGGRLNVIAYLMRLSELNCSLAVVIFVQLLIIKFRQSFGEL